MRRVRRSAHVPYTAEEMYALVVDVEAYPEFLPWCTAAEVHERTADTIEATLELKKGTIRKRFRTRNTLSPAAAIDLSLVGGPFRELRGGWRFAVLGESGSKVTLDLEFEFESRVLDMMIGAFFEETCNALVDAFSRRAASLYGAR